MALAPMSAYERKIVHDAVADLGLVSESEGEGADRHIVVSADCILAGCRLACMVEITAAELKAAEADLR